MKKSKDGKTKRPIFNEEVDSAINGYALGISFVGIGVFLLLKPDYFAVPVISYILGALIGVVGVIGTGIELSKSSKVKGFDNIILGIVLLGCWIAGYLLIHAIWGNILIFILLILGCYSLCLGLFQGIYSIFANLREKRKTSTESKSQIASSAIMQVVLFMTQLCGLVIAILNVVKVVSTGGAT